MVGKQPFRKLFWSMTLSLFLVTQAWAGENSQAEADYTLGMKYYTGWDDNCGCYNNGGHAGQNPKEATEWFRKAAELGMPEAQFRVGQAYDSGRGAPQDYAIALRWYMKAAEQNDRDAESALGDLYTSGHGVKTDPAQASEWYYKAAEQGVAHAQAELGKLYLAGKGVNQDFVKAYFWYGLAAKEIDEAMDGRDDAGGHLTAEQLQAVRRHIEQWHPSSGSTEKKREL